MRGVKKTHLPHKTCPACQRPFAWRRKWARDWAQVVYCSARCRRARPMPDARAPGGADAPAQGRVARHQGESS